MTRPWPPELQSEVGDALIVAGNALVGYAQLSNGPETEEHHQAALHALEAVRAAILKCGALEEQGIVPETWGKRTRGIQVGDRVQMLRR